MRCCSRISNAYSNWIDCDYEAQMAPEMSSFLQQPPRTCVKGKADASHLPPEGLLKETDASNFSQAQIRQTQQETFSTELGVSGYPAVSWAACHNLIAFWSADERVCYLWLAQDPARLESSVSGELSSYSGFSISFLPGFFTSDKETYRRLGGGARERQQRRRYGR